MEKQWNFSKTLTATLHREALSRQNHSAASRHLGGLDSLDGNDLFIASCAPLPTFCTRAFVLWLIAAVYDQSLCWQHRSRCAARTICRGRRHPEGSTTSL